MKTPRFSVTKARALDVNILELEFADGARGLFDMAPYLEWDVYAPLRDATFFGLAMADHGTVAWPGGIDIAPEILYDGCCQASANAPE